MRLIIGLLLSVLCLWFLFRETDWHALFEAFRNIRVYWLLFALSCSVMSLFARVQRWSYVVRAGQQASFRGLFNSTQIGMFVNSLTPARLGELVRAYILARSIQIPFSRSLTLVALDRVNDIIAFLAVLILALASFPIGSDIEFPPGAFGNPEAIIVSSTAIKPATISLFVVLSIAVAVLVFVYFRQEAVTRVVSRLITPISPRAAEWLNRLLGNIAEGLHVFRSPSQMAKSVLWSLITWGLVGLSVFSLMKAFDIPVPWHGPLLILAILGVFTSVTVTPGMIGQYHIPFVAGLLIVLPGHDVNEAKAVAILAHLVALMPVVLLGVYAMMSEKLGILDLVPASKRVRDNRP